MVNTKVPKIVVEPFFVYAKPADRPEHLFSISLPNSNCGIAKSYHSKAEAMKIARKWAMWMPKAKLIVKKYKRRKAK